MSFTILERVVHTRLVAVSIVDALARALRTSGEFPVPLGTITLEILEQTLPAPRQFDPPWSLWTVVNPSGFVLTDGTFTRPAEPGRKIPLADGVYRIRVRGDFYRDGEFLLNWPPALGIARVPFDALGNLDDIELMPGAAYALPDVTTSRFQLGPTILRGTLFRSDGTPMSNVRVGVQLPLLQPLDVAPLPDPWPFFETRSSDRGDWLLVLPGRRYLDPAPEILPANQPPLVRLIALHFPDGEFSNQLLSVQLGTEHSVRNTALRGQVVRSGGSPVEGAVIGTSIGPLTTTSRRDGVWFLYFDLGQLTVNNLTVTVTTPDGATASDANVQIEHARTLVVPTFHVP